MSDYTKFKELTKPLKFRPIRRVWNTIRTVIPNIYYNILYKLNIIDKVSNSDETSRQCATLKTDVGRIVSNHVMCDVVVKVVEHLTYKESYYKTKKGKIIPIYHYESATVEFLGSVTNIAFNFTGECYYKCFDNPVYTYQELKEVKPFDLETPLRPPVTEVMRVDTSCARNARVQYVHSGYYSDIPDFVFNSYYHQCYLDLRNYIENIDWEKYTTRTSNRCEKDCFGASFNDCEHCPKNEV